MALLTGQPRLADVVALTYCRLLVLRKLDFDQFMGINPQAEMAIKRVAAERTAMNRAGGSVGIVILSQSVVWRSHAKLSQPTN